MHRETPGNGAYIRYLHKLKIKNKAEFNENMFFNDETVIKNAHHRLKNMQLYTNILFAMTKCAIRLVLDSHLFGPDNLIKLKNIFKFFEIQRKTL